METIVWVIIAAVVIVAAFALHPKRRVKCSYCGSNDTRIEHQTGYSGTARGSGAKYGKLVQVNVRACDNCHRTKVVA